MVQYLCTQYAFLCGCIYENTQFLLRLFSFSWGEGCHFWLKLTLVKAGEPLLRSPPIFRLPLHPFPPSTPPPFNHSTIFFSFLLALWQHRRICSLKVPPSPSGSHGWRFLGNSVRVDWVGADRWLPFIRLHHSFIKSKPKGACVLTRTPVFPARMDRSTWHGWILARPGWGCVYDCVCCFFSPSVCIE